MCSEIESAIGMIRDRFPLKQFPYLNLEQINLQDTTLVFLLYNNKLNLIEGMVNNVIISYALGLDIIFLQQPAHPTYPAMSRLHRDMKFTYEQPGGAPQLVRPFHIGLVCVTRLRIDEWYRSEIVAIQNEKDQAIVRLVDVGGYFRVPIKELRQIRVDFVTMPFQATECRLAHIIPCKPEEGWSLEAVNFFKVMTHGKVLQAQVVGYSNTDGSTLIYLYRLNSNNKLTLINEELINHGYGRWITEIQQIIVPWVIKTEIDDMGHSLMDWTVQLGGYYLPNTFLETNPSFIVETDKEMGNLAQYGCISSQGSESDRQAVVPHKSIAIMDTISEEESVTSLVSEEESVTSLVSEEESVTSLVSEEESVTSLVSEEESVTSLVSEK